MRVIRNGSCIPGSGSGGSPSGPCGDRPSVSTAWSETLEIPLGFHGHGATVRSLLGIVLGEGSCDEGRE